MHRLLMFGRCPEANYQGLAVLPHHRFIIMHEGYASVVPAPGHAVHGVLWRLSARDVAVLNADENLDGGLYRAANLSVMADRRRLRALVYVARSRRPGRPEPGYMPIVMQAAREAGLPAAYIDSLRRWAPAARQRWGRKE